MRRTAVVNQVPFLADGVSAIYCQRLPDDKACFRAAKPQNRRRNLTRVD